MPFYIVNESGMQLLATIDKISGVPDEFHVLFSWKKPDDKRHFLSLTLFDSGMPRFVYQETQVRVRVTDNVGVFWSLEYDNDRDLMLTIHVLHN